MNEVESAADEWMSPERCRQLLSATRVSRVAFVVDGAPRLVVLNHTVDGDDVVFQTSEDTALAQLVGEHASVPAVVETDSASSSAHTGWSIIASGQLSRTTASELGHLPHPWRPEAVGVLLRLHIDEIHGMVVGQPGA